MHRLKLSAFAVLTVSLKCYLYTVCVQIFAGCIFCGCLLPDNFHDFNVAKPWFAGKFREWLPLCKDINTLSGSDITVCVGSLYWCFTADRLQVSLFYLLKQLRSWVYKDIWAASVGAVLQCEWEAANGKDP